jgi:arylsulfatase A-like enzyme
MDPMHHKSFTQSYLSYQPAIFLISFCSALYEYFQSATNISFLDAFPQILSLDWLGLFVILTVTSPFIHFALQSLDSGIKGALGILSEESAIQNYLSHGLSLPIAVLPLLALTYQMTAIAHGFNQVQLASLWVVLFVILGLIISALIYPTIYVGIKAIVLRLPTHLMKCPISAVFSFAVIACLIIAIYLILQMPLEAYQLSGYYQQATALASALILAIMIRQSENIPQRFSQTMVILQVLTAMMTLLILSSWDAKSEIHISILNAKRGASIDLMILQKAFDRDGDGYAFAFGGGDCNDQDPKISPAQKEIPNNDIDDNCSGGDQIIKEQATNEKATNEQATKDLPTDSQVTQETTALVEATNPKRKYNVLMILVDTLRANHLSLYGYSKPTSVHLDQWAKESFVFQNAIAQAPRTPLSIPSLLTGVSPSKIKWEALGLSYGKLLSENQLIFEYFKQAGWQTQAITSHWYFGAEKAIHLDQGVDLWDNEGAMSIKDSNLQSEAGPLTDRLIKTLAQKKGQTQPFFLFTHYFAPHSRYLQHDPTCSGQKAEWCHIEPLCEKHPTRCKFGEDTDGKVTTRDLMDKYDSEIAYIDLHLNRVFQSLEKEGLLENTIVLITSDHGESFKDRGETLFHGTNLYQEELHVPMVVRLPKQLMADLQLSPKKIKPYVGLVDLIPTLLEITQIKISDSLKENLSGISLWPLFLNPQADTGLESAIQAILSKPILSELLPYGTNQERLSSLIFRDGKKLMKDQFKQQFYYFDLTKDPKEKRNLFDQQKGELQSQIQMIEQMME